MNRFKKTIGALLTLGGFVIAIFGWQYPINDNIPLEGSVIVLGGILISIIGVLIVKTTK